MDLMYKLTIHNNDLPTITESTKLNNIDINLNKINNSFQEFNKNYQNLCN